MILRQLSGDRRVTIYLLACLALIGWGHSAADKDQPKGTQDVQILNVGKYLLKHKHFFVLTTVGYFFSPDSKNRFSPCREKLV